MRNFYKLSEGVKVDNIMQALARQPDLWNQNNFRTTFKDTPFGGMDDIILRFPRVDTKSDIYDVINQKESVWYDAIKFLPEVKEPVLNVMRYVGAYALDRLIISRMKPGNKILGHIDDKGSYVNTGDVSRYHLVLQGLPGSLFTCGEETVNMKSGELWWFNPHLLHSAVNNSVDDRIHLLIDVRYF